MCLNHNDNYNKEIREWIKKTREYAKFLSTQNLVKRDCPVCKSKDYNFYINNGALDYTKCNNCDLIFMNPSIDESSINDGFKGNDQLLMSYFELMQKYKKFEPILNDKLDPTIDNKLRDIYKFKQSGTLLDIGCSIGDFLHKAKHFYNVEGVEINPDTSLYAKKYFTIYTDYLDNLNLSKKYDIITLHQILYGVPDNVSLFQDIHKILNDDGVLYINTPNSDSYAMKFFKGKCNHVDGYTTQNIFNKKSLEKLAQLSGFKISFFRTEWLDIYNMDIQEFYDNQNSFIHKRNTHLQNYTKSIKIEDEANKKINMDLKNGGNYLVAILEKI